MMVQQHLQSDCEAAPARAAALAQSPAGDDQVFSFTDVYGVLRLFSIAKLLEDIATNPVDWPLIEFPIGRADAQLMLRERGVLDHKVKALPLSVLPVPGIMCVMEDGSNLIVDGSHRLVKRVRRGLKTMLFFVGEAPAWSRGLLQVSVIDGKGDQ